jgi:hypothetical protein
LAASRPFTQGAGALGLLRVLSHADYDAINAGAVAEQTPRLYGEITGRDKSPARATALRQN